LFGIVQTKTAEVMLIK